MCRVPYKHCNVFWVGQFCVKYLSKLLNVTLWSTEIALNLLSLSMQRLAVLILVKDCINWIPNFVAKLVNSLITFDQTL